MILYHISKANFNEFFFSWPSDFDGRYCQGPMVYFGHSLKECINLCDIDTDKFYLYTVEVDDRLLFSKYGNLNACEVVVTHDSVDKLLDEVNEEDYDILLEMLLSMGNTTTKNNKFFKIIDKKYIEK